MQGTYYKILVINHLSANRNNNRKLEISIAIYSAHKSEVAGNIILFTVA